MDMLMTATNLPSDISGLNQEQYQQILTMLKIDDYKDQMRSQINNQNFDLGEVISNWLLNKAEKSKKTYTFHINNFIQYLGNASVLDVNAYTADVYKNTILSEYSVAKAKVAISSISSFYTHLVRWGFVSKNPFKGMKIKNTEIPSKKNIPSTKEVERIIKSFNSYSNSDKKMRFALYLMSKYGVRVGFFNQEIQYDGEYLTSFNKGKWYRVLVKGDAEVSRHLDLLNILNSHSIQSSFNRRVQKLYADGCIFGVYSPHDLRHYVAVREYQKDKDIYRVSKLLNHASISITEVYLKGIGIY